MIHFFLLHWLLIVLFFSHLPFSLTFCEQATSRLQRLGLQLICCYFDNPILWMSYPIILCYQSSTFWYQQTNIGCFLDFNQTRQQNNQDWFHLVRSLEFSKGRYLGCYHSFYFFQGYLLVKNLALKIFSLVNLQHHQNLDMQELVKHYPAIFKTLLVSTFL